MDTVRFEKVGDVAVVRLHKPPHNLIDDALTGSIVAAYERAQREGCRAILLNSAMRHFCAGAGADVNAFIGGRRRDQESFEGVLDALENVPLPTVAAVHGAALGGGVELALTADLIVAADTAVFGMVEASLGLLPLLGGVQRMVQRIGAPRAKELPMFARRHNAATRERWGAINLVVPEDELATAAMSCARQLAAGPTVALAGIKRLAKFAARHDIAEADRHQTEVNERMWASEDQKRGLAALQTSGPGSAVFEGR